MKRILLTVSYDGTNYSGWQKQKDKGIQTVQGALEEGLGRLFKKEISCTGSSRTDAGVHALGQRAMFDVETTIPTERIPLALNSFLNEDVVVTKAEEVPDTFHCRFDTKRKTYEYKIYNADFRNPIYRNISEFIYEKLDIMDMRKACPLFCGEHDFKAFCASGSNVSSTVRTIYSLDVMEEDGFIKIRVCGNGFLYNMVRIIAGTLVYVGLGKIKPHEVSDIIEKRDRRLAGKTLAPQGLTLISIEY